VILRRFGVPNIRILKVIFEKLQHDIWLRFSDKIEDLHSFLLFLLRDIIIRELVSRMNIVSHILKDIKKL
jgi:hypothetical protein